MAWSAPMTAVANTAFTAAQFNQYVRDNLSETGPAKVSSAGQYLVASGANALVARSANRNTVLNAETTTSTTYTDLTTTGPTLVFTSLGTSAFITIGAKIQHNTALGNAYMSYAISGASTVSPDDNAALGHAPGAGTGFIQASWTLLEVGLTAGSNTFQAKYRTNTGTATFDKRRLMVFPL